MHVVDRVVDLLVVAAETREREYLRARHHGWTDLAERMRGEQRLVESLLDRVLRDAGLPGPVRSTCVAFLVVEGDVCCAPTRWRAFPYGPCRSVAGTCLVTPSLTERIAQAAMAFDGIALAFK